MACCPMPPAERMRRGLRWLLLISALAGLLVAFGLWRLSRDDQRLTALLADSVQAATGLTLRTAPGRFGFWPQLAISLEDIALVAPADQSVPVRVRALAVSVPWRSLFGKQLRIGSVRMSGVNIDQLALMRWQQQQQDLGPAATVRWPRIDAAIEITQLAMRANADTAAAPIWRIDTLKLNHWRLNQIAELDVRLQIATLTNADLTLNIRCTPRQSRQQIALEPCAASLTSASLAVAELRGFARWQDRAHIDAQWQLSAADWPPWLADSAATAPRQAAASDLMIRLVGAIGGPLKLKLVGTLLDAKVAADLILPYGWWDRASTTDWAGLADTSSGVLSIDHWQLGGSQIQGIRWQNPAAAAGTASDQPTSTPPRPAP